MSVILVAATLLGFTNCMQRPSAMASKVGSALALPKRYDTTPYPTPEVAAGLLSLFSNSQLKQWVNRSLQKNPDLKASAARLEEAGFNTRKSYAATLPSLTGSVDGARSQSSFNSGAGFITNLNTRYSASLDVNWELDVWGRIRAGVTAASANQAAARADYMAARQSIAAQTMQAYFEWVAAEKLLALSQRRLESFQKSYELVNRRFEAGTGNLGDLDLSKTDVENTRAQVSQRKDARDQAARKLRALAGGYPSAQTVSTNSSWPSLRRSVRSGLPSDLLMQRPDIDAAYQRIRAADASVTVAHRDLYPRFTLTASGGRQSGALHSLTDPATNVWSLASGLTAPLFDGGNRRAELGAANARAKQAYASYQSIVINAFREVENALGSEQYLLRQVRSLESALAAARRAESRVRRNYEAGLVEILTLLDAQRRSFNTEESLINTRALRYQNRVTLALALGKGV